jgi:tetratricopeptide (TPR) repeat protein
MKRILIIAAAFSVVAGCTAIRDLRGSNPYEEPMFYERYLNTGSHLDTQIANTLAGLRNNPQSPELHNALGALLVEKGFPKDAEVEFERAVNADGDFFPAWYNLGLVRASRGDEFGARRAFNRTVDLKPGHAIALFQLGLIEEKREHIDKAIDLYAKAFKINPALLDVEVNPRILDTRLTHRALIQLYPDQHSKLTMQFQETPIPQQPLPPEPQAAPSPQARPQDIVTPAAPVTDPAMQQAPPATPRPARRRTSVQEPTPPPPATSTQP